MGSDPPVSVEPPRGSLPITAGPDRISPRVANRIVWVLMLLMFLGNMTVNALYPAMPEIQRYFNATTASVQTIASASIVVFGFCSLIYGPLADRYGRRPMYLMGMIIYALGSALCAVAPTLGVLIVGRMLSAGGSSVLMVVPRAMVRDMFDGPQTTKMIARIAIALSLSPLVAPPVGGVLVDTFGWRSLFIAMVGLGIVSFAVIYFFLPETLRERGHPLKFGSTISSFGVLLKDRHFVGYSLNGAMLQNGLLIFIASAPFFYVNTLGLSATAYSFYYMATIIGTLIGYAIATRLAGRFSHQHIGLVTATGCIAMALADALISLGPVTPLLFTMPMFVYGIFSAINGPSNQAALLSGDPRTAGAVSGLSSSFQMLTGACLVQFVGVLPHDTGFPMMLTMMLSAIAALIALLWVSRGRTRAEEEA